MTSNFGNQTWKTWTSPLQEDQVEWLFLQVVPTKLQLHSNRNPPSKIFGSRSNAPLAALAPSQVALNLLPDLRLGSRAYVFDGVNGIAVVQTCRYVCLCCTLWWFMAIFLRHNFMTIFVALQLREVQFLEQTGARTRRKMPLFWRALRQLEKLVPGDTMEESRRITGPHCVRCKRRGLEWVGRISRKQSMKNKNTSSKVVFSK